MIDLLLRYRGWTYFIVTVLLVVFLYSYIFHIYRKQRSGEKDYEKYGRLALDDNLDDELIEAYNEGEREDKQR